MMWMFSSIVYVYGYFLGDLVIDSLIVIDCLILINVVSCMVVLVSSSIVSVDFVNNIFN